MTWILAAALLAAIAFWAHADWHLQNTETDNLQLRLAAQDDADEIAALRQLKLVDDRSPYGPVQKWGRIQ